MTSTPESTTFFDANRVDDDGRDVMKGRTAVKALIGKCQAVLDQGLLNIPQLSISSIIAQPSFPSNQPSELTLVTLINDELRSKSLKYGGSRNITWRKRSVRFGRQVGFFQGGQTWTTLWE
jgi:hypothetical protein